jgi:hypothetical protein
MDDIVFSYVMPCSLVWVSRYFGATYCKHIYSSTWYNREDEVVCFSDALLKCNTPLCAVSWEM